MPRRAACRSSPSSSATGPRPTPRTSRCRRRAASGPCGPRGGRSRRPASAPADIDHVNAHATSTPEGDKAELQAMRTIFGDDAGRVAITANKSMLGHTLGAAGAIEAIATILAIREGCVPPTINLVDPDPEGEGLDLTPNIGRATRHPHRAEQLVRVRWPEHGPGVPAVGRMTDGTNPPADPAAGPGPARPPRPIRRRATVATSSSSRSSTAWRPCSTAPTSPSSRSRPAGPVSCCASRSAVPVAAGVAAARRDGGRRIGVRQRPRPPASRRRPAAIRRPWPARR